MEHADTTRPRGWTSEGGPLAPPDVGASMLVAFGAEFVYDRVGSDERPAGSRP